VSAPLQRRAVVDEVELDGEVVLFDGFRVHHLAGPAAAVWRLADGSLDERQMVQVLAAGYATDEAAVRVAVRDVLATLHGLGLLVA
jgi:hypothetical protein